MFYYLVQDLKALVFSLISLHFKVGRPLTCSVAVAYENAVDQANLNSEASPGKKGFAFRASESSMGGITRPKENGSYLLGRASGV